MFDPARLGEDLLVFLLSTATMRPSRSKTMQRDEVVPWSMAAMNGPWPWEAMPAEWSSVTVCSWRFLGYGAVRRRFYKTRGSPAAGAPSAKAMV
ncbi:hypothetical protein SHIRM173S_00603 [Streptomyces hirsutus]